MVKRKESEFEKLARLIKDEGEEIRTEIKHLEDRMDQRFDKADKRMVGIEHKIEAGIQPQLTDHSRRIGSLEIKISRR